MAGALSIEESEQVNAFTAPFTPWAIAVFVDLALFADGDALSALACQEVDFHLCAVDSDGRKACDSVTVVATPDPLDVADGLVSECE